MTVPKIGEPARPFRLPSAAGGEIALDDYKGQRSVVLWFTKGMGCAFCRQQMSQLARAYPGIRDRGGEVLEVTASTPERARFYANRFRLPFPYLCDPDYRVRREWGLEKRAHPLTYYAKAFMVGAKLPPPPNDFGSFKPSLREFPSILADDDMGLFIIDRAGVVRYTLAGAYFGEGGLHPLPGPEEITRELDRCALPA
jgi:peroxiredoxin